MESKTKKRLIIAIIIAAAAVIVFKMNSKPSQPQAPVQTEMTDSSDDCQE